MTLHEYLENKRRQNIRQLNATSACHICGSNARHSAGLSRLVDSSVASAGYEVDASDMASMRTCGCYGSTWPYSLRVCDMCIKDDAASLTGRVRHCGICGVVACDEDCGVELVECTDVESWNNPGCLECRKLESFREIAHLRTPPPMDCQNLLGPSSNSSATEDHVLTSLPRMTRVCTKCLTSYTPWVKYDFVCRRFKCETRLVPSDIAERKRYCLLAQSRSPILRVLPEDGLAAIIDFLGGEELCNLFRTNSTMSIVAEKVAKTRVEQAVDQYPSGPICVSQKKCYVRNDNAETDPAPNTSIDPRTEMKTWIYAKNEHDFELRAPDDAKTWVGLYHYLITMTAEDFYFGFQTRHDSGAVYRFIEQASDEKFAFNRTVYVKVGQSMDMSACNNVFGCSLKGGQVAVFDASVPTSHNVTFASNKPLASEGKSRFIGRLFCPGTGGLTRQTRDILGSLGVCRIHPNGTQRVHSDLGVVRVVEEGAPAATWVQKTNIMEGWLRDDSVFGVEYDAETRVMTIHTFGSARLHRSAPSEIRIPTEEIPSGDSFVLAFELGKMAARENTLLSIRECNSEEFTQFIDHLPEEAPVPNPAGEEAVDEAVLMAMDIDEREDNGIRRIRRRIDNMRARRRQGNLNRRGIIPVRGEPMDVENGNHHGANLDVFDVNVGIEDDLADVENRGVLRILGAPVRPRDAEAE